MTSNHHLKCSRLMFTSQQTPEVQLWTPAR